MEVILLERIERLGQMGEVVNVKPGFARNFLLPNKKALRATKDNIAYFEKQRAQLETQNLKRREEAEGVAKKMEGLAVIIVRQASESDQLYGSVSSRDITNAITEAGFTVDKSQVMQDRPIKTVGLHQIRVRLHPEVSVSVTANVARSPEEAAIQARGERVTPTAQQPETGETPESQPEAGGGAA
jgi:large subunit ribosomal protein L9